MLLPCGHVSSDGAGPPEGVSDTLSSPLMQLFCNPCVASVLLVEAHPHQQARPVPPRVESLSARYTAPCPTCRAVFAAPDVTTIDTSSAGGKGGSGREVGLQSLAEFLRGDSAAAVGEPAAAEAASAAPPAAAAAPGGVSAHAAAPAAAEAPSLVPSTSDVNSAPSAALVEPPVRGGPSPPPPYPPALQEAAGAARQGPRRGRPAAAAATPLLAPLSASVEEASAGDRLGGKLVALVRRLRALPPGERAIVATSWPALRRVIGSALDAQARRGGA